MAEPGMPSLRRRVWIAVDNPAGYEPLLAAALQLAGRWQAEVAALFVEDIDLLNLAALPFARELGVAYAPRQLELPRLEQHLQAAASAMRGQLSRLAEAASLPWEFRVARGRLIAEVLAALTETDLLLLQRAGARRLVPPPTRRPVRPLSRFGSGVTSNAPVRPPLLLPFHPALAPLVPVALALAAAQDSPLCVVLADSASRREWEAAVAGLPAPVMTGGTTGAMTVRIHEVPALEAPVLLRVAQEEDAEGVLLGLGRAGESIFAPDELEWLALHLSCPLWLGRV